MCLNLPIPVRRFQSVSCSGRLNAIRASLTRSISQQTCPLPQRMRIRAQLISPSAFCVSRACRPTRSTASAVTKPLCGAKRAAPSLRLRDCIAVSHGNGAAEGDRTAQTNGQPTCKMIAERIAHSVEAPGREACGKEEIAMAKITVSLDQLRRLMLAEVRKQPGCDEVVGVEIC